jgi:hypothetical protein
VYIFDVVGETETEEVVRLPGIHSQLFVPCATADRVTLLPEQAGFEDAVAEEITGVNPTFTESVEMVVQLPSVAVTV